MGFDLDDLVVGAGPVGAAYALAAVRAGRQVCVLEAHPDAAKRLAGEWLHPAGVAALKRLGVADVLDRIEAQPGCGFVVWHPGEEAVVLDYPEGTGISFDHARLVAALREALADAGADVRYGVRAQNVAADGTCVAKANDGAELRWRARRIVAADGRNSVARRGRDGVPLQSLGAMTGVLLRDVDLPYEGYGHVFLGGPGPVLVYRLDAHHVRVNIDVPPAWATLKRHPAALVAAVTPVLPPVLAAALADAVSTGRVQWAATQFRVRRDYAHGRIALVGDAVGCAHPLTAAGLAFGFGDAAELLATSRHAIYVRRRRAATVVPELLAAALYEVFVGGGDDAEALRRAVFASWRRDPGLRVKTMRLLGLESTRRRDFAWAFARIGADAATAAWRAGGAETAARLVPWGTWPLAALLPDAAAQWRRLHAGGASPWQRRSTAASAPSDADWDAAVAHLEAVSRTFALPIAMLEEPLRRAVTVGYLLCRIADTVEDHPSLSQAQRAELFPLWLDVLAGRAAPAELASAFPALDRDAELDLIADAPRVWRVFKSLPQPLAAIVLRWVSEMSRGMQLYALRPADADGLHALLTESDLERYCYYVAGTVGHMLTDLFLATSPVAEPELELRLRRDAEAFGMGLQLVNILKNIIEDRERGWSFVPRSVARAAGISLSELTDPSKRVQAHAALASLDAMARRLLDRALEYSLAIPPSRRDVRLFCLLPLWLAVRTLVLAAGNDAVLTPGTEVKIERSEVSRLIQEVQTLVSDDAGLRRAYAALWHSDALRASA